MIFKDEKNAADFKENGYVVISLLSPQAISQIKELYFRHVDENNITNFSSVSICEEEVNNQISEGLHDIFAPYLSTVLKEFSLLGGTFLIKKKSSGSLGLHQDNTCVDEKKDCAAFMWTPTEDVNIDNGCMYIIRKSHTLFNNIISYSYKNPNIFRKRIPDRFIQPVPMKAGDVLFFNPSVFHGSYKNQKDSIRVSVNSLVTNADAKITYYDKVNEHTAALYEINLNSYLNSYRYYCEGKLPKDALYIRDIEYRHQPITHRELYKLLTGKSYPFYYELYNRLTQKITDEYS